MAACKLSIMYHLDTRAILLIKRSHKDIGGHLPVL